MEKIQILVVEDESIVARDIQRTLQSLGYEVASVVSSGEAAIQEARENRPDLVLMDIVLKGKIDGIEAAEQTRSRFNIPVVYLTAYTDDKMLERAKITEPFGYIVKPFEDRELKTAIEMALYKAETDAKVKQAAEQIKASLKEKEILLREVHHRIKNNMQVISSLLRLQSEVLEDAKAIEIFRECQDRVKSMALVHEKFYCSKDLSNIDFADYIKELTDSLIRSYGIDASKIAIKIDAKGVSLGINLAVPCGLLVNELISNSLKHAFPKGRSGEAKVSLRPIEKGRTELIISDNGVGLPEDLDFRKTKSLGLQLVNTLVKDQLGGEIELDRSAGTEFKITLPP